MPMEAHMREATTADLPAILELYRQLGQDDGRVLDLEAARRIFARIHTCPEYRLHVAQMGEQVVGVFGLLIMGFLVFEPHGLLEIWRRVRRLFHLWPFRA